MQTTKYKKENYDPDQWKEIQYGLKEGLDVKKYDNCKFNCVQMRIIRRGLQERLFVDIYTNPNFNIYQMFHIYLVLKRQWHDLTNKEEECLVKFRAYSATDKPELGYMCLYHIMQDMIGLLYSEENEK